MVAPRKDMLEKESSGKNVVPRGKERQEKVELKEGFRVLLPWGLRVRGAGERGFGVSASGAVVLY